MIPRTDYGIWEEVSRSFRFEALPSVLARDEMRIVV